MKPKILKVFLEGKGIKRGLHGDLNILCCLSVHDDADGEPMGTELDSNFNKSMQKIRAFIDSLDSTYSSPDI